MTESNGLLARVYDALYGHLAHGNEVIDGPLVRFVRNPATPDVYDVNHGTRVRASTADEMDTVFARADDLYVASRHRRFFVDPWTPPVFEARLALDGYELSGELSLLLEGELAYAARGPSDLDVRLLESDEDWASFEQLLRLDHDEEQTQFGRPRSEQLTRQLAASKRAKGPDLRFWIARTEGFDSAFLSSWPGTNGIGIVEDLFTRTEFRHRGIATGIDPPLRG